MKHPLDAVILLALKKKLGEATKSKPKVVGDNSGFRNYKHSEKYKKEQDNQYRILMGIFLGLIIGAMLWMISNRF